MHQENKVAKCEACGKEKKYTDWPKGWHETYVSKYGKQYNPDGLAWWCSEKCLNRIVGQTRVRPLGFVAITK